MLVMSQSMASYSLLECIVESAQFARGEIAFYDEYCELIAEDGLAQRTSPLTIYYSAIEHFRVLRSSCTLRITVPYELVQRWAAGNGFDSQLVISESSEEKAINEETNELHQALNNVSNTQQNHLESNTTPSTKRTCCLLGQLSHEDLLLFMSNIAPVLAATRRSNSIHDVRSSSRISVTQPLVLRNAFIDPSPPLEASLEKIDEYQSDESSVSNVDDHDNNDENNKNVVEESQGNNFTRINNDKLSTQHNYEHEWQHSSKVDSKVKPLDAENVTTYQDIKNKEQVIHQNQLEEEQTNNHETMENSLSDQLAQFESMVTMDINDIYNNNHNNKKTLPRRGKSQMERAIRSSRQKNANKLCYNKRIYNTNNRGDGDDASENSAMHSASVSLQSDGANVQYRNNNVYEFNQKSEEPKKELQCEQNQKQAKHRRHMSNDKEVSQTDLVYNKLNVDDANNIKNTGQLKRRRKQPSIATSKTQTHVNTHTSDKNNIKSITENKKTVMKEEQYNNDTSTKVNVATNTSNGCAANKEICVQRVGSTIPTDSTIAIEKESESVTVRKSASQHWTAQKVREQPKVNCDISTFMSELLHLIPHETKPRPRQTRTAAKRNITPAERKVKRQKQESMANNNHTTTIQTQEMQKEEQNSGLDAKITSTHKNVEKHQNNVNTNNTNNNKATTHFYEENEEKDHNHRMITNEKVNKSTEMQTNFVVDASMLGLARKSREEPIKTNNHVVQKGNNMNTAKVFTAVDENNEHEAAHTTGRTSTKLKRTKPMSTNVEEKTIADMHIIDYTPSPMTEAAIGDGEVNTTTATATATATNKETGKTVNVNNKWEKTYNKREHSVSSNESNVQFDDHAKSNSECTPETEIKESCRPFPLLLLDDEDVICAQKSRTNSTSTDQVSCFQNTPKENNNNNNKDQNNANNSVTVNKGNDKTNVNTSSYQKDGAASSLAVSSSSFFLSSLLTSKQQKQQRMQYTGPKHENSQKIIATTTTNNNSNVNDTNVNAPNRKERLRKLLRQVNVITQSLRVIQECHEQLRELVLDAIDDGDL